MSCVFAVDIGGTKIAAAIFDESGKCINKHKIPTIHNFNSCLDAIAAMTGEAEADAVGLVVPGIYNEQTGMAWAPNLWGWEEVPLRGALQNRIATPIALDCDRSAYVLGEQWQGAARGYKHVVFVAVGTGIGVGILANGHVIRGAFGIAGAAGWFALSNQWKEEYARTGCWETEAAGPALARHAEMAAAEDVLVAARNGDPKALAALAAHAEYIGIGVANLISALNPEIVVLGGGLMQAGDLMLQDICAHAARWAQPIAFRQTSIVLSSLGEDAGLIGAARLGFLQLHSSKD